MATDSIPSLAYRQAQFLVSAPKLALCPPDKGAEVAFAGRSNAGKSSAINRLTEQKSLARTSKTPGRTQLLNFFQITPECRLVDLPGYGFAKVPLEVQQQWQRHLTEYLEKRRSLKGLVLVMDSRHPLKEFDQQTLYWANEANLSIHLLLTKADKLKRQGQIETLRTVERFVTEAHLKASAQLFSSTSGLGLETLRAKLDQWLLCQSK